MAFRIWFYGEDLRQTGVSERAETLDEAKRVARMGLADRQGRMAKIFDEEDGREVSTLGR